MVEAELHLADEQTEVAFEAAVSSFSRRDRTSDILIDLHSLLIDLQPPFSVATADDGRNRGA